MNERSLRNVVASTKYWLAGSILMISSISWYYASAGFLQGFLSARISINDVFYVWVIAYLGAACLLLFGSVISSKFGLRLRFILIWVVSEIIVSVIPLIGINDLASAVVTALLFTATWSFGIPACMAYFAESTSIENRAKTGGLILSLSVILGALSKVLLVSETIYVGSLYLVILRGISLLLVFKKDEAINITRVNSNPSFSILIKERALILYIIPWILFILINDLFAPIAYAVQSEEFVRSMVVLGTVLAGVFSIIGGFFADIFGRKPTAIIGFVMLGFGYALLGIFPSSILSWYFYTVVDGLAWGLLFAIFLVTIWGDLATDRKSDKYYAVGLMPFIVSKFLSLTIGQSIAILIPANAIFSFTALFLFLAVVPLMFAPETLPEKTIRERELKSYVEKAKRVREKFT